MSTAESMVEPLPISRRAMARPPYLEGLNPPQLEAVESLDGPVLVLSGAGTGKTRVLTARLAHLIATRRAQPWQILAVTFTNKAAREMRARVEASLGPGSGGLPFLGTFHSISAQMLRRHAELAGLKSNFTILDTDDQIRLLKQIIEAAGIDEKRWTARALAGMIDDWKNRAVTPDRVPADEAGHFADGRGRALYAAYQERLRILNACDFGDLLVHMIGVFQANPDLLADYQRRLTHLMVDEYQDTNVAQYLWLRLLARGHNNLCVVGDDDQSIYSWRGAEVDNILRFEQDFPGAKVVRLEQNYRSTGHVLATAAALISRNKARLGKTLWTADGAGEKVKVRGVWDGEEEARAVAEALEAWRRDGRRYGEAAILVRAAWQMRAFEDRFSTFAIPHRVVGGPRFFERAEIRDAHAYLRLIRSADDDLAFERVINQPKRGFGESSLAKLSALARERAVPLTLAAQDALAEDMVAGKARAALGAFLRDLDRWRSLRATMSHVELAEIVLDESGYVDMLRLDKSPTAQTRLENLKELVRSMGQFDTLESYLDHVQLVLDIERESDGDQVTLMTLHAAKGLEWPLVFLPGWEESVFPSQRSVDEGGPRALEEERRLAYVGITRARERAHISFAANRQIHGRWQAVAPSRFIDELPEAHVEIETPTGYGGGVREAASRFDVSGPGAGFSSGYSSPGWRRAQERRAEPRGRAPVIEGEARLVARSGEADARFARGQLVTHERFGRGVIKAVEGNKLLILFETGGEKRVIDTYVTRA